MDGHTTMTDWFRQMIVFPWKLRNDDYAKSLKIAKKNSAKLGLRVPSIPYSEERLANEESPAFGSIQEVFREFSETHNQEQIICRCFSSHFEMMHMLREVNIESYLTFGWISSGGKDFHKCDFEYASRLIHARRGPLLQVEMHAWLTLPTHEIIDLTFLTSMQAINNKNYAGQLYPIFRHHSELIGETKYHPIVLGEEYLERSGLLQAYIVFDY